MTNYYYIFLFINQQTIIITSHLIYPYNKHLEKEIKTLFIINLQPHDINL